MFVFKYFPGLDPYDWNSSTFKKRGEPCVYLFADISRGFDLTEPLSRSTLSPSSVLALKYNVAAQRSRFPIMLSLTSTIQWWPKLLEQVFSPAKKWFKSVISIFCCSVSVGNISLHFQTFILPLIVIIQWDFCLHKEPDNSQCSTEIWGNVSSWTWKTMRKCTEGKSCFKDAHTKCWSNLVNRSWLIKKIYSWHYFDSILIYSIFTQEPKTFNSTVALQVGSILKHLEDIATVLVCLSLSVSSCHSRQTGWWWDLISVRSTGCCQTPCANKNLSGLLTKWMFRNVNRFFPTTHYSKI